MQARRRLVVCLVAGVLLLAVSVGAAFGSVNGYDRYKQAAKDLLLREENFTAQAQIQLAMDGAEIFRWAGSWAKDGADSASVSTAWEGDTPYREYITEKDGVRTSFSEESCLYDQGPATRQDWPQTILGVDADDEMNRRLLDFAETALDLAVGNLKNNVVQLADEGETTLYQVNVAQVQIPTLLNAGLPALAYYLMGSPQETAVEYADYLDFLYTRYEQARGVTLSQEIRDRYALGDYTSSWYEAHRTLVEDLNSFAQDWASQCAAWEGEHKGVLYYRADGTEQTYATVGAFLADHPEKRFAHLDYCLAQGVAVDTVVNTFRLDQAGRLADSDFQVTLTGTDQAGERHTFQAHFTVAFAQYGTTAVPPLDVGERQLRS